jgi:hypothetical protein
MALRAWGGKPGQRTVGFIAIRAAFIVLALSFAVDAAAQKAAKGRWGAIAYSTKTGAFGYAVDRTTKRDAETEAFRLCGTNCDLIRSFRNSCGAVATRPKRVASDTGASREIAEAKALKKCGDACKIAVWACTK